MDVFLKELSLLLVGSGVMAYVSVVLRQPIIVAYIAVGVITGPWGLGLIKDVHFIEGISHLGITLLLFLAGLNLQPSKLFEIFRNTTVVVFISSAFSFILAFGIAMAFNFTLIESAFVGLSMMFSSTILVVKLLPTTQLHHARLGVICIGVLILQDLLAVAVLAFIRCVNSADNAFIAFSFLSLRLIGFIVALFIIERYVIRNIMHHVERLHEVIFILGLAWCFGIALVSSEMGLFYETGAFFAGVALANHRIALFIAESLKPIRDFFLVMFFFALGTKLDFSLMGGVLLAAGVLSAAFIILKPLIMRWSFTFAGETDKMAQEASVRLGQLSEFSLLIALLAVELNVIGGRASQLIQVTTILTFIASSYLVVLKYQTPIGTQEKLIKD